MKRTDVLTGRIAQRVIDASRSPTSKSTITVTHGVDNTHNIGQLMGNLFEIFPGCLITLKELEFGYELRIEVDYDHFRNS